MVQRKAPDKPGSQFESKKNHVKSEKRSSSHQHEDIRKNKGGRSDLKKKMKKSRSIKVSDLDRLGSPPPAGQHIQFDEPSPPQKPRPSPVGVSGGSPNYMKPTSCSDAKKGRLQVSIHPPNTATDKNRRSSKRSSSSGLKPAAKALTRKSSLKPVRSSMKKSLGFPLYPKTNASRNTCSSTMKDSKFPNFLDLHPGGTQSEGASVLEVCSYTYCSLNGHRHAPSPPLKCFLSARRRLLKIQKSMKLKELLSPIRTRGSGKDEMEIDTGQMELDVEVGDDFFVEIYAKPQAGIAAASESPVPEGDDEKSSDTRIEEDGRKSIKSLKYESGSETSSDENLDRSSDLSVSEMERLTNFLEYVDCDHEVESQDTGDPPCLEEDYLECILSDSGKIREGGGENEGKESVSEASDMDCGEDDVRYVNDEIDCSGFTEDDTDDGISLEADINGTPWDKASSDAIATILHGVREEYIEETNIEHFGVGSFEGEDVEPAGEDEISKIVCMVEASNITISVTENEPDDVSDQNCKFVELEVSKEYDQDDGLQIAECDTPINTEDFFGSWVFLGIEGAIEEPTETSNLTTENSKENQEKPEKDEREEFNKAETGECQTEKGCNIQISDAMQVENYIKYDADEEGCLVDNHKFHEEDTSMISAATNSDKLHPDTRKNSKASANVTRKKADEDLEELKSFNPRAPNFLPIEPDPEGEKVDLRHQMMDDRKNAEEWMIDYALRQAVTKLAPARKRKVALLVEAFETVKPIPTYEAPIRRRATVGFAHARPMQACS